VFDTLFRKPLLSALRNTRMEDWWDDIDGEIPNC
jgi:hypothetical protein